MHPPLRQPALQEQTLRFYGELAAHERDWAGKLVLGVGEGCASGGLPAACSVAGAACLFLEPNALEAKKVLLGGGIDFMLSTVVEVVRSLKSETGRGGPLAMVITGEPSAALKELQECGISPDLFFSTASSSFNDEAGALAGVRNLDAGSNLATEELQVLLDSQGFKACTWPLPGRAAVRAFDRALLELIGEEDALRKQWLEGIPRYQRSADQDYRACWVTEDELDQIADLWMGQAL